MSIIQRIQERQKWVFGSIALALILFILQDYFFNRGRGSLFTNTSTLGKINGEVLNKVDFEQQLDMEEQQYSGRMQRSQLMGNVWNVMVNELVLNQEFDKLGLTVSAKELSDILFGNNPPQWLQQAFTDQKTGQFDMNAARQQFSQIKKRTDDPQVAQLYLAYIQPTIEQALAQKYQAMVTAGIYVPKWMAEKTNADNNSIAKMSYIKIPYSTINDSSVKVTDDDVDNFVKKHANQYKVDEETKSISYVIFSAAPSKEDSAVVVNQLNLLKPELVAATDLKSFLTAKGSEIEYTDEFTGKNGLKGVRDSISQLADGQTDGPYINGQNYVIAKMVAHRVIPDSAKCRHILIKTEEKSQPVLADSLAKKRIDSVEAAVKAGANFDSLVQKLSDDAGSKATKGEYTFPFSQFSTISKEFAETIFYGKVGDKKVVKVSNATYAGYHYIEVLEQKNMQPAYNVAYLAKPITASQETNDAANNESIQFAANSRDRQQFEATATKMKKTMLPGTEIKENDFTISGLGESRELVRWIYKNKTGDVSEPTLVDDKYVVAVIIADNKPGLPSASAARPLVENIVKNEKKAQQIINTKIRGASLDEIAKSAGVSVRNADSIYFKSAILPAVGNEMAVLGATFNKQVQGKLSSPIAGVSGVFVIRGEGISATASMGNTLEAQRRNDEMNLKQQIGYRAMGAMRKAADIKDFRSDFY